MPRGGARPGAGRKKGSTTRPLKERQEERNRKCLYSEKSQRAKEFQKLRKAITRQMKDKVDRVTKEIGDKVKTPEEKAFEPIPRPPKGGRGEYRVMTARVPKETHIWFHLVAKDKSASITDILITLVKCAQAGVVFDIPQQFTTTERKFYAAEIRKQRRLQAITKARIRLRNALANDKEATYYGLDPDEVQPAEIPPENVDPEDPVWEREPGTRRPKVDRRRRP